MTWSSGTRLCRRPLVATALGAWRGCAPPLPAGSTATAPWIARERVADKVVLHAAASRDAGRRTLPARVADRIVLSRATHKPRGCRRAGVPTRVTGPAASRAPASRRNSPRRRSVHVVWLPTHLENTHRSPHARAVGRELSGNSGCLRVCDRLLSATVPRTVDHATRADRSGGRNLVPLGRVFAVRHSVERTTGQTPVDSIRAASIERSTYVLLGQRCALLLSCNWQ